MPIGNPTLCKLLQDRVTAALGTVDGDVPYVSMVPFAVSDDGCSLVIHVSRLAAHTGNMLQHPRVSVLVSEAESSDRTPQALARVTIQGTARPVDPADAEYAFLREAYTRRFPSAQPLFDFRDFVLVRIDVESARLVSGFAQAITLSADAFARAAQSRSE